MLVTSIGLLLFVAGGVVSTLIVVVGFFAHGRMDPDRGRYLGGAIQAERIAQAVERYRVDCGDYPSADGGLDALVVNPGEAGWAGPYLSEVPLDPWGRPYSYSHSRDSAPPEILSYGRDGKPGGASFDGDISSFHPWHPIPASQAEDRQRRLLLSIWAGAWLWLIGAVVVVVRSSRRRRG